MGKYEKVSGKLQNDLPVFKKVNASNRYIYFDSSYGAWVVDSDLDQSATMLLGKKAWHFSNMKTIPRFGWLVHDGNNWVVDETLIVSAGDAL